VVCRRLMWMIGRSTLITVDSEPPCALSGLSLTNSNPSDEVVEWFWKIVKAWPAERKVSSPSHSRVLKLTNSPVYYNSQLVPPESPLTVSKIYKVPMVLDDSLLKKLERLLSCLNHILVSTESIYRLTRHTRLLNRN
jgi:hypothetical protein